MSRFGYKTWSHARTWIFTAIALTLVVLIVFWSLSANEPSDRVSESNAQPPMAKQSSKSAPNITGTQNSSSESAFKFDSSDYAQCEQFIQDFRSESASWGRENYQDWVRYLEQGYSLDEITLAVEHFANSNFAASFRVKQLRKGTEFTASNQQLNEQLLQQFPELADSGLSIQLAVPLVALESFETMTNEEKRQVLTEHQVGVNDIAYFIHSGLADEDILMMLKHITVPAATVSYEKLEAISLLDFAIAASRPVLVEHLLHIGLSPTSDAYLGSSMEWALSRLNHVNENTEANAVKVVKLLKLHGAAARFIVKRQSRIEGDFPRKFYSFSKEQIASLSQNYQLDLMQIEQREVPTLEEQHPLLDTLAAQLDLSLAKKLATTSYLALQESCQHTIHDVNNRWQPESADEVVRSIEGLYDGSPELIIGELATIDPVLVDIYRGRLDRLARPKKSIIISPAADTFLYRDEIQQAIRYFEAQLLSDEEKRWLGTQMLGFNVEHYAELKQSSLWLEELQFSDLMLLRLNAGSIEALEQAGANLRGVDNREKTLMYYAAERKNVSLVSFLEMQGYPFSFDDLGQDPLHVVLRADLSRISRPDMETLVDTVMKYQPDIDAFHRSRMAVIQLKYPQLYQSLVSRHAELAITGDTPLPHVR